MSLDHPVLNQVVLGASTLFDVKRAPYAARLTVFPQRPDAPVDAQGLLSVIDEIAPAEAGPLMLSIAHEGALRAVLAAPTASHLMIEVPGFMLADPGLATLLEERVATGLSLVLGGRVPEGAPAQLWALFRQYGSLRVMAAAAEMSGKVAAPALPFPLASLSGKPRETLAAILAELALA